MTTDYVAEILRATGTLRPGDPAGVTAIVQNALALAGLKDSGSGIAVGDPTKTMQMPQALLPGLGHTGHHSSGTNRLRKPLGEVIRTLKEAGKGLKLEGLPGLGQSPQAPELPLPKEPA